MVLQAQGVRDFLQEPVTQRSLEQFDMVLLSLELDFSHSAGLR